MLKSLIAGAACALAALAAGTASAEAYKWVDADGQVHYSDRPPPAGAQKVELIPVQTYRTPASQRAAAESAKPAAGGTVAYAEFELRRPQTGEVIQNSGGTVSVELRIEPALQQGHSIWLYLDGKRIDGLSTKGTSFELSNVWRGEHRLVAAITEPSGKPVVSTPPVTFMVRQTSIAKPPQGPALRPSTGSKP